MEKNIDTDSLSNDKLKISPDDTAINEQLQSMIDNFNSILKQVNSDGDSNLSISIENGLEEAKLMLNILEYVDFLKSQNQGLIMKYQRLNEESSWLREEFQLSQTQVRVLQEQISVLQVEKEQLTFSKYIYDRYDSVLNSDGNNKNNITAEEDGIDSETNILKPTENSRSDFNLSENNMISMNAGSISSGGAGAYEIPSRLRILHNLVVKYASEERYEVAVPLCNQALEDLKKDYGPTSPDVATMQNILALVYRDQGKLNEAIDMLKQALEIRENSLGPEDPTVAATLNNLAVLYGKLGRFKEAEPLCRRSLKIREKVLGEEHIDVAKQLSNLALLCQNLGRFDDVEAHYQRALTIYRKELGPNNPNVTKTMNNLASSFLKQPGKLSQAEALFKTVIQAICSQHTPLVDGQDPSQILTPLKGEPSLNGSTISPPTHQQITSAAQIFCQNCPRTELQTLLTSIQNLCIVFKKQNRQSAVEHLEKWSNALITAYTQQSNSNTPPNTKVNQNNYLTTNNRSQNCGFVTNDFLDGSISGFNRKQRESIDFSSFYAANSMDFSKDSVHLSNDSSNRPFGPTESAFSRFRNKFTSRLWPTPQQPQTNAPLNAYINSRNSNIEPSF